MKQKRLWMAILLIIIIVCGLGVTYYTHSYEPTTAKDVRTQTVTASQSAIEADGTAEEEAEAESESLARLRDLDEQLARKRTAEADTTPNARKATTENERRLWESEMNRILTELEAALPEEERTALFAEQNEWVRSRENAASEASDSQSSSAMEEIEYNRSFARITRERAYELVQRYEDRLSGAE